MMRRRLALGAVAHRGICVVQTILPHQSHRLREGLKEERTACINRIRWMLTEFGLVVSKSSDKLREKRTEMQEDAGNNLSGVARFVIDEAYGHCKEIEERIKWCDRRIHAHVKNDAQAKAASMHLPPTDS